MSHKLRTVFYLLLATNLVLLLFLLAPVFGLQDIGGVSGEPERIANQLHAENIRVLPQGFEPAPAKASETLASTSLAPPAVPVCVAYQDLSADQATVLSSRARGMGEVIKVREEGGPASYWINIPPQGGKQGAERRTNDLKQMGIDDFFTVQDAGATQYAISLGLYRTEAAAKRQLEILQKKGLRTAVISVRENAGVATRIELTGPADVLQRLSQDLTEKLKGAEQVACQAG